MSSRISRTGGELALLYIMVASGRAIADEPIDTNDTASTPAETTALIGVDSFVSTADYEGADVADLAWSGHLRWRTTEREVVADFVERESLIGSAGRRELHELAYTDRSFAPWTFEVGRFRVPGGFWLITDGGAVTLRAGSIDASVYGGARSFTNARTETLLRRSPVFLPLFGAAVQRRGELQARVAYTYTRDIIVLPGNDIMSPPAQPDHYLDAEVLGQIGERITVLAAATAGTRYLFTFPTSAMQLTDDPRLETMWFGSQSVYSMIDIRAGDWRISTSQAAHRTKLGQVSSGVDASAITGSFVESSTRASWHRDRTWRASLRYRARVFADRRHAHRAYASASWRHGIADVQLGIGADIHAAATAESGFTNPKTLLYRASGGIRTEWIEASGGVAAVSSIGDELAVTPGEDPSDMRNPYTLDARNYAFAHAFATHGSWFGGLDVEVDLFGNGLRCLVQAGWGR